MAPHVVNKTVTTKIKTKFFFTKENNSKKEIPSLLF
jgi:hypothetical protein